jgi:hypothetical protein
MNHFNKYLATCFNPPKGPFDILNADDITRELIGQFPDYLQRAVPVRKCKADLSYVSAIKTKMEMESRFNAVFNTVFNPRWYKTLRNKITKSYLLQRTESGARMVDSAPPIQEVDLFKLCHILFKKVNIVSMENRYLLSLSHRTYI